MNEAGWSDVIEAVAAVGQGKEPETRAALAATALGFLVDGQLTAEGTRLLEEGILRRQDDVLRSLMASAVWGQPGVRELLEGDWGQTLDRQRAENVLRWVHPPTRGWQGADFTRLFETLNYAGFIKFNRKTGLIRNLVTSPSAKLDPRGALISPSTPYRNRRLLAELVHGASARLWWFDPHFVRQGVGFIYDEADFTTLADVRVLSCGRAEIGGAMLDEYRRVQKELALRNVVIEWRTLLDREEFNDKHDRWLLADDKLWNIPPFTAIMQDKFGSLLPDPNPVPLQDWWDLGVQVDKVS